MTAARTGPAVETQGSGNPVGNGDGCPADRAAQLERRGDLEVLAWPALGHVGVDAVVTTRAGGVSAGPYESLNLALHVGDDPQAVLENRRRAATALGADLDDLVFGAQVHGTRAAVVGEAHRGRGARDPSDALADTDALVTSDPGIVLVTLVADCIPVLLFDPEAGVLSCAHAGWRGALSGVLQTTVDAMRTLGALPQRMVAFIGPGVAKERYQVGAEVFDAARAVLGADLTALAPPDGAGRWLLDLSGTVQCLLERAGVPASASHTAPFSTGGPFFSDRATRPCGRFGLLARILP